MHRKLLAALVSACALAAVLVGPASASAATLTLKDVLGSPNVTKVHFEADRATWTGVSGSYDCDGRFAIGTDVTQNGANPVTLAQSTHWGPNVLDGCRVWGSAITITYSNIQLTGPMTFSANGTGSLPLSVTETWYDSGFPTRTCTRQGVLNLTYTPHTSPNMSVKQIIRFDGYLTGGACGPSSQRLQGSFSTVKDRYGQPITWVVTP